MLDLVHTFQSNIFSTNTVWSFNRGRVRAATEIQRLVFLACCSTLTVYVMSLQTFYAGDQRKGNAATKGAAACDSQSWSAPVTYPYFFNWLAIFNPSLSRVKTRFPSVVPYTVLYTTGYLEFPVSSGRNTFPPWISVKQYFTTGSVA